MINTQTTKSYYDILDGLRGIAAITILVFHYTEMIYPDDYVTNPMGHGFLAVDFFYCLSGFVIAFAYDYRAKSLGVVGFFKNRLIRLHPLVILGTVVGLVGFLFDPFVDRELFPDFKIIGLAVVGSLLLIPTPFLPYRWGALFPYNSPSWSLFFEYLANILYIFVLSRINKKALLIFGVLSAGWLVFTSWRSGWLIGGWDILTYADAFPRVTYSFIAGLLIFRFRLIWENKYGFWLPLLMLLGVFFFPHRDNDWITESILVVIIFPLIICVGAGAKTTGFTRKFCLFIGRLSYPLYMTHITTVWIYGNYYLKYNPTGMKFFLITTGLIIFNLIFAWVAMCFYDEPVRKWLNRRMKKRKSQ